MFRCVLHQRHAVVPGLHDELVIQPVSVLEFCMSDHSCLYALCFLSCTHEQNYKLTAEYTLLNAVSMCDAMLQAKQ